jgi:hypothetical protein
MEILLSALNSGIFDFMQNNEHLRADLCIIHQITDASTPPLFQGWQGRITYEKCHETGLSKSRNRALELAMDGPCLMADDDGILNENVSSIVETAFRENRGADIITFQIISPEGAPAKKYKADRFWHDRRSIAGVSSVEIAFRREAVIRAGVMFDEQFGLGAEYPTGEEFIFLSDALEKGLKILYLPIPIVRLTKQSSGRNYQDRRFLVGKGAMIARVFGRRGKVVIMFFALKKFPEYRRLYSLYEGYTLLQRGYRDYWENRS